jgi:hypothetical protein
VTSNACKPSFVIPDAALRRSGIQKRGNFSVAGYRVRAYARPGMTNSIPWLDRSF